MGIDLFPWQITTLSLMVQKSVTLTAYSQAFSNTKSSFSFGFFLLSEVGVKNPQWM